MEHFEPTYTNQPPAWRLPAIIGGIVLLAGVLAFVITGTGAPAPAATPTVAPTVETAAGHGDFSNSPPAPVISVADAHQRWQAGQVIFVDMRSGDAYKAAHLPGALSLASPDLNQRLAALPSGGVIIAYGDASRPEAASAARRSSVILATGRSLCSKAGLKRGRRLTCRWSAHD